MNILYIPPVGAVKEHDDFYLSLSKSNKVIWYWDAARSIAVFDPKLYGYEYDIIHLQSGAISRNELAVWKNDYPKAIITQWTGDYRPEGLPEVRMYEGLVDITFLASDTPEQYPNMNVKWLPHWVGEWQFRPVNPDAEGIVMIANNYTHFPGGLERHEMNEILRERDDYVLYGSGFTNSKGPVNYRDTPDIYNQYQIAVGCNIFNNVSMYFSNRPLAAMAAGCAYLWKRVPSMGDVPCLTYTLPEQVIDLLGLIKAKGDITGLIKNSQQWVRDEFHSDVIVKKYPDEL